MIDAARLAAPLEQGLRQLTDAERELLLLVAVPAELERSLARFEALGEPVGAGEGVREPAPAAGDSGASSVACSQAATSVPMSPARCATRARSSSPLARTEPARLVERGARARAIERPQPQPAEPLPRRRVGRRRPVSRCGGVDRLRERAHVLVDARGVAVRRGPLGLLADPVAHGARRGRVVAGLPERERQQAQHRGVAGSASRA